MMTNVLRWRDTKLEVPEYKIFGHSPQVIGLDVYNDRNICRYIRGGWYDVEGDSLPPPVKWHYLPKRPS